MEPEPQPARNHLENYKHGREGANRVLRLKSYEHVVPATDWIGEVVKALDLKTGRESVLDIGAGTGEMLMKFRYEYNHRGVLAGIDPQPDQFDASGIWYRHTRNAEDVLRSIDLRYGRVQEIPYADNSFERVTSIDQMYTVDADEQDLALQEIKRVLTPSGLLVLRTSGRNNKLLQRHAEKFIAARLSLETPELMNRRYDSDRARSHLKEHFRQVVHISVHRTFLFTAETLDVFYGSLTTMTDQLDPIPRASEVDMAYLEWLEEFVAPHLERTGRVVDLCERDMFIAAEPIY